MKNRLFYPTKRKGIFSIKIVFGVILLSLCLNSFQKKEQHKWNDPKDRILVRELNSILIMPPVETEKPKPPLIAQPVSVLAAEKNSNETQYFLKKKVDESRGNSKLNADPLPKQKPIATLSGKILTQEKKEDRPLIAVEEMPRFPGCETNEMLKKEKQKCAEQKLLKYIRQNIRYPELAMAKGIQGVVYIQFVVEKNGRITGVQLTKDIGGNCGQAAMEVVKNMPSWHPGRQGGIATRVQFNLPVKFKL